MEYGSRETSVHIYLHHCVIIGQIYPSTDSLLEHFNISGQYVHIHDPMWVPYKEGTPPKRAREVVLQKDELLFVIDRDAYDGSNREDGSCDKQTHLEIITGPFGVDGYFPSVETVHPQAVLTESESFFELHGVTIAGPLGANFSEPHALINKHALTFIAG